MLRLYNTLTRRKEIFKPLRDGIVTLYTCGPTVYDFAHIGNFRAYIFEDILRRYLEYKGYKVKHIMNITDIDDKTIRNSEKEGVSLKEFTERYTKEFFKDIDTLNIERATKYPKATEYVQDMIELTRKLIEKGYAYEKCHSVYYDISKFKDYGKLSRIKPEELKVGARVDVDEYEKNSPQDFALMKRSTLRELKRGIYYETEWGKVRPGWHIECSVMSMKNLGETIDIHTGGVDNIFPHHENEIAQSEAATGKKFVNYWLHCEHLLVNGRKMSKSLGNFYTLRDLLAKGAKPKAIRYLLLSTHYRQQLNFTFKALEAATNTLQRLNDFMLKIKNIKTEGKPNLRVDVLIKDVKKRFEKEMDDDLNISNALAAIFDFIREINKLKLTKKDAEKIYDLMMQFDKVLGVLEEEKEELSEEIKELIKEREKARKEKNYEKADRIRDELRKRGIILEDTKEGVRWKKI